MHVQGNRNSHLLLLLLLLLRRRLAAVVVDGEIEFGGIEEF